MAIVTVGVDLAKKVFAVHGIEATGQAVLAHPNVPVETAFISNPDEEAKLESQAPRITMPPKAGAPEVSKGPQTPPR